MGTGAQHPRGTVWAPGQRPLRSQVGTHSAALSVAALRPAGVRVTEDRLPGVQAGPRQAPGGRGAEGTYLSVTDWDSHGGPVAKTSVPNAGASVQSLLRELDPTCCN